MSVYFDSHGICEQICTTCSDFTHAEIIIIIFCLQLTAQQRLGALLILVFRAKFIQTPLQLDLNVYSTHADLMCLSDRLCLGFVLNQ